MNGLALLTQKIEIIHFFHWHIPTIGPIKVNAWIGMLETRDGSTQLTGNDSIVETRQMEILMTAIFKEQQSNSWKIIIIIEMVISQNFGIIHNPLLSISLCGINHVWYMMVSLTKTWIKTPWWGLTNVLLLRFSEHFPNYSPVWRIFCFLASCECWEFIDQLALRNTTVIIH